MKTRNRHRTATICRSPWYCSHSSSPRVGWSPSFPFVRRQPGRPRPIRGKCISSYHPIRNEHVKCVSTESEKLNLLLSSCWYRCLCSGFDVVVVLVVVSEVVPLGL